ncbi:hypothetical protein NKR23_g10954 [Pleurostoma richardsiae]|uniref:F-box domain-containing protein n=1 Tax=Pleurostoma richardsiae TaxID=41990 RepID=A0AA38R3S1_9PEZI|nr:hypothetical protein NKR23_g10954 [Pleurostoma richardsiae]
MNFSVQIRFKPPDTSLGRSDHVGRGLRCDIERLPGELHNWICSMCGPHELKKLRLTCKVLEEAASMYLFRRVAISRLRRHLSVLQLISGAERLARHVREIVWYDLDRDQETSSWLPAVDEDGVPAASQACRERLSWLPCQPNAHGITYQAREYEAYDSLIRDIMNRELCPPLAKIGGICSVALEPMPVDQVVTPLGEGGREDGYYPYTVQTILSRTRPGDNDYINGRLFVILWEVLTQKAKKAIINLACVDNASATIPWRLWDVKKGRMLDSEGLTSISLTLRDPLCHTLGVGDSEAEADESEASDSDIPWRDKHEAIVARLGSMISKSPRLERLSVALLGDDGGDWNDSTWSWEAQAAHVLKAGDPKQDRLLDLRVRERRNRDVLCGDDPEPDGEAYRMLFKPTWQDLCYLHLRRLPISDASLVSFIERHASSLRRIILEDYRIPFHVIEAMRNIPELVLARLEISCDVAGSSVMVAPHLLLGHINKKDDKTEYDFCFNFRRIENHKIWDDTSIWELEEDILDEFEAARYEDGDVGSDVEDYDVVENYEAY